MLMITRMNKAIKSGVFFLRFAFVPYIMDTILFSKRQFFSLRIIKDSIYFYKSGKKTFHGQKK